MVAFPYRDSDLATEANAFAECIAPAKERWMYCLSRTAYQHTARNGQVYTCFNDRTFPVCDRIIGCHKGIAASRLRKIEDLGWDGAAEWVAGRTRISDRPYFYVGPMQPWHVGHVYLARVVTHPHVVKIGFSRRVLERLEDIEATVGCKLFVKPGELHVGTLADEHWWHRQYQANRITGEWFLDGAYPDNGRPAFLNHEREAA